MLLLALLRGTTLLAQPPLPPAFFGTYQYTSYTVYDTSSDAPPTQVHGVGGTLTLRADSTYEKRFSLVFGDGPHYFNQTGRFAIHGDSIRFAFTDLKGPDVQAGTFRYLSDTRRLTITIAGYPPGNKGVYELAIQAAPATITAPKPAALKRRTHH